jgi:hypothetical protein
LSASDQGASQGLFEPLGSIGVEINLTVLVFSFDKVDIRFSLVERGKDYTVRQNSKENYITDELTAHCYERTIQKHTTHNIS